VQHVTSSRVHIDPSSVSEFVAAYRRDPVYRDIWTKSTSTSLVVANFGRVKRENELLFLVDSDAVTRLCVPKSDRLRTIILYEFHNCAP
jgi:hypothetical protein